MVLLFPLEAAMTLLIRIALVGALSLSIALNADVLFFDDFENGSAQWEMTKSMELSSFQPYSGSFSQTFTETANGGDARTVWFAVEAGQTYYLHVAYMTLGGGGYVGIDQDNAPEVWLMGDGPYTTPVVFDYNYFNLDPNLLGKWNVYTVAYTVPAGVHSVRIKTEDWEGGLQSDPTVAGVFFDNLEWSTNQFPSYLTVPFETTSCYQKISSSGKLQVKLAFELASTSNGIQPDAQAMLLSVGQAHTEIPEGSFRCDEKGYCLFKGFINTARWKISLRTTSTNSYFLALDTSSAEIINEFLSGAPVTLTIGDDIATFPSESVPNSNNSLCRKEE